MKARKQSQVGGAFQSTWQVLRTICSERGEFSGGLLGATLGSLYYPLNVVKARKQSQVGGAFQSTWQVLRTICSERGEFSGGLLGATLGSLYYPLNVVKARKQSQVGGAFQSTWQVLHTICSERGGKLSHLYRGAHLNYHRSLLSWGITNAAYELLTKYQSTENLSPLTELASKEQGSPECEAPNGRRKKYVCSGCAGMLNIMITFPIHKVLFRQQLFGVSTTEAVRQLQRDGMWTLYRGLLQKTSTMAIMFGFSNDMSRLLSQPGSTPGLVTSSMAAVLAGTVEASLTPFERIQTLLQDQRHHVRYNNTFHAFRTLVRENGMCELYHGTVLILLRNGPSNVLFLGLREPIKSSLPQAETHAGQLVTDFVSGGLLGATLGSLYYPLNVVKARKQSQVGGAFQSTWQVLRTICSEQGGKLSHLYRGAHLNYHRSLLSWGITNAAYELLTKVK
ncbi:mitochondrial nicotinamide adenine dinucleotide transporter SLC25A51-like [Paramormyrops kingsleyae]|uniref:mitochondrial nicotinamide adenine dinucleotide transporter SLC25A51-like n=1 Tax=Paramormyrops kingsleyae TaxID=1676925 RepID=UPI003B9765ED